MKRRGLFSFLAAAPVGIAGAAGSAVAATQQNSDIPKDALGICISHPKPLESQRKNGNGLYFLETELHGSVTIWKGELYLKKPNGEWRKIS